MVKIESQSARLAFIKWLKDNDKEYLNHIIEIGVATKLEDLNTLFMLFILSDFEQLTYKGPRESQLKDYLIKNASSS